MKCFFIQKTSPSLGTFSCEHANVVRVSCEFQKYVTTLWKRCLAKHTSAAVSSTEASLIQFYFFIGVPSGG